MPSFSFLSLYALTDVQYHHYDANLHFHLLNYSKHTQITSSTSQSKPLFSLLSAASKHACIEQNLLNLSSELQAMFSGQMHYAMGVAQQAAHRCCVGVIVGAIPLSPTPLLVFPKDVFSKDGISVKSVRTISNSRRRSLGMGAEKKRRVSCGVPKSADQSVVMSEDSILQETDGCLVNGGIREYFESRGCPCFDSSRVVPVTVLVVSAGNEACECELPLDALWSVITTLCEVDSRNGWRALSAIQHCLEKKHVCFELFHNVLFTKKTEVAFAVEYLWAIACHSRRGEEKVCGCGCGVEWEEEDVEEVRRLIGEEMKGVAWIVGEMGVSYV